MIGDVIRAECIYIVCGYTDMRKAIGGKWNGTRTYHLRTGIPIKIF